ncbi:hypothetical protein [Bacillus sp. COPE52]|uniref:hypothetical protein n=1 Tax=Bacillus sp. COPE52 TaxID=2233998 RepID=UPI000E10B8F6|nr:hypothetical protein [Bacillus sp. COPE52]AXK19158.1 hypothetical protein DPQ31_16240 [Bacillus sp. COPE52]
MKKTSPYLEAVKEDRMNAMNGLKELAALPKLKESYSLYARNCIKREIRWIMKSIHDMNKIVKLEEKKNV